MKIDHLMFTHINNIIIAIYVDDLLILGLNLKNIWNLKRLLLKRFRMKDLESVIWYLNM